MSYALNALVLIRLDARVGEWVPIEDLAAHVGLSPMAVQDACERLADAGDIHHATHEGQRFYGVGVEGVPCIPANQP